MKIAATLLLLLFFLSGCRKNGGSETTPEPQRPEYTVERTQSLEILTLPFDTSLPKLSDIPSCGPREFYDTEGKKQQGYETGVIFYLGFFPNVSPEERVNVLKKWSLFRRTDGYWIQSYDITALNQCFLIRTPDSLITCAEQRAFMKRLLDDPTIKFANPFLLTRPVSTYADRILDELVGEAAVGISEAEVSDVLTSSNIRFFRRVLNNRAFYTLVVPKGERNALDWATLLIEKGYFRILYPSSFEGGRRAGQ